MVSAGIATVLKSLVKKFLKIVMNTPHCLSNWCDCGQQILESDCTPKTLYHIGKGDVTRFVICEEVDWFLPQIIYERVLWEC